MSPELLALLRCPETRQPLRLSEAAERALFAADGDSLLVRADGLAAYPVENGLPVLLPDRVLRRTGAAVTLPPAC